MALPLVAAGLSLVPQVMKYVRGRKQQKQAEALRNSNTLDNQDVPEEVLQALGLARSQVMSGTVAGQTRAENKIASTGANTVDSLLQTGGGSAVAANLIGMIQKNQNNAIGDLSTKALMNRNRSQYAYQNALRGVGAMKQTSYDKAMAAAAALEGAGIANQFNAVEGAIGSVAPLAGGMGNGGGFEGFLKGSAGEGSNDMISSMTSTEELQTGYNEEFDWESLIGDNIIG